MKEHFPISKSLFFWLIILLFGVQISHAQNIGIQEADSLQTKFDIGKIVIPDPDIIKEAYSYNPYKDSYYLTKTFDGFNVNYPLILTRKEFEDLIMRAELRKYFLQRFNVMHGREENEEVTRDMLPRYYVNSKLFSTIFGSNTIDVKPTGSVEFDMGVRYSKQDNPVVSTRNRKNMAFDFNQRISMGLQGMVGTRLAVNINYDTQATFDFQNMMKLSFAPDEDDIVRKVEVGNVSMPISGSLVRGAQSLFGVKTELQFGRTTITGVFSEQKSQTTSIRADGGGTLEEFELFALDYDEDRHFFLSQYFRNNYDEALEKYPFIKSRVRITRVEVWITNRYGRINQTANNARNIIALQDLGEGKNKNGRPDAEVVSRGELNFFTFNGFANAYPDNANNMFDPGQIGNNFLTPAIRLNTSGSSGFTVGAQEGKDFVRLEGARKLNANEFTFHPQLGYISLNQRLSNDEVLAVAFQYSIGDKIYQVGEFGTDGGMTVLPPGDEINNPDVPRSQSLILKMLKSNLTLVGEPVWKLMMKNIYQIPNAMYISQDKFRFNILYTDPSPLNYISSVDGKPLAADVERTPLLKVFHLDRLNYTNDPQQGGDGFFDFLPNGGRQNTYNPNNAGNMNNGYGNNGNNGGYGNNNGGYGNNNGGYGNNNGGYGNNNGGYGNNNQYNSNTFEGITIDPVYGRIIFTTVEPFGEHLFNKLAENKVSEGYNETSTYNKNQAKYVFRSMYRTTKTEALRNQNEKNKFQLKGKFSSSMGEGIPIGSFNVAPGSVVVKAAGRVLVEGVDYTVDYSRGRVMILDPGLQASNTPIEVSVENNTMFGQQTKRFFGMHVEHKFSKDFIVGGTFLHMSERPFTHKSSYGQEAVNNTIWGLNAQYSTEVPFLTRLVNKLPNIDTDVESRVSVRGEFAYLQPGNSKLDQMNGEATSYIDDFEGMQSVIDVKAPLSWKLSSVPIGFHGLNELEKTKNDIVVEPTYSLEDGYRRSKMSWYTIDPTFYVGTKPAGVTEFDLSSNRTRRIYSDELFPNTDIAYGESRVINTLDLTFYPEERGPYNFNENYLTNPRSLTPRKNWGGIMRGLTTTNFEQANIEFVEFWVMDPYYGNEGDKLSSQNIGELRLNLGFISEDILRDGHKQYENGLPDTGANSTTTITTIWGKVPSAPSLVYAFDTNAENRRLQDVGLDGLSDDEERIFFKKFAGFSDPAADNFIHYLDAQGGILERYRDYNGMENNSPAGGGRAGNNQPDAEDIDGDNTMNTINAYYEYKINIKPETAVGDEYVTDVRQTEIQSPDGSRRKVKWIQYKIPIDAKGKKIGPIEDTRSMRFMRMYLTGFEKEVTMRFATLNLVRSDWKRFSRNLIEDNSAKVDEKFPNTEVDVTSVNLTDNFNRKPIPYVTPPGVRREQVYMNNTLINQNEQSLSLRVYPKDQSTYPDGLVPLDARAVYKNFNVDMRQYKKLRMFIHGESLEGATRRLQDYEMAAFIRIGSDVVENFYEIEVPLKITNGGETNPDNIWPTENELNVPFELLAKLKVLKMGEVSKPGFDTSKIFYVDEVSLDPSAGDKPNKVKLGIKGNPNFGKVRMMMIGIRNITPGTEALSGEFWFDELRMSDMDNKGGWAGMMTVDANLADFANISLTGMKSTIGFGGLEQGPQQRSREDRQSYSLMTNVNLGQLLPKKWGITVPFNYAVSEEFITPEYDPMNPDLKLSYIKSGAKTSAEAEEAEKRALDYTKRKSINFIGVNKQRGPEQKSRIYDIENVTLSHSYNEVRHHDFEVESMLEQQVRSSLDYTYAFETKTIEPFKNIGFMQGGYWGLLKDFNFNYVPSNISFSSNIMRQYNRQEFRLIDVEGIGLDPLYRRNYFFNYNFGFNFDLTKSIRLSYIGGSNNVVRNYYDSVNGIVDNTNTIWDDYFNIGEPNQFTQQVTLNYELPFSKIPVLSFIRSNYAYTGNFNWQRASDAYSNIEIEGINYNIGNTIQNSRTQRLNTTFGMETLYRYLGLVKSTERRKSNTSKAKKAAIVPGQKVVQAKDNTKKEKIDSEPSAFMTATKDLMIGVLTSVKNIQVNYSENSGTMLPGFLPSVGFFGTAKPDLGFVFGNQADIRYNAARSGYLTEFPEMNQPYTTISNKTLNINASVVLIPDLTIDLYAERMKSDNYSEQFVVEDREYIPQAPYSYGNFSISTIMISTAFSSSDLMSSATFDRMLDNRIIVANRLATERGIDISNPANLDREGFPIGYSKGNQSVLLPSFLAAYSGQDAGKVSTGLFKNMPLPNWNLKYRGLMKLEWFKNNFKNFSLNHGYRASYTLGSFSYNTEYYKAPNEINKFGNFPSKYVVNNATMFEQFNPLIRVDAETKSSIRMSFEMRKDRMLSLSFDNNLLTETNGNDFVVGLGYRVKDVGFNSMYANNGMGGRISSDINIKADFTLTKRETIVRYLDYGNSQSGGGQDMWSLRLTADYMLSRNLTAIFFYDHSFSKAVISTMYPITNIRAGFTMRYNFGN
ncbi:cell surface protein SprA [Myroides sp. M-43]|uniref:T9SS outer membrane translocon Sov/SprA n=1 Tax=Myroides oncorhynchi TaxID=2893756 RepID=UPI001E53A0A5|nr:cell surface protein SprA [Myroides oncorhynchi]MCC9042661.1 cell surface protein SprA [Myroides oncorhynchi]